MKTIYLLGLVAALNPWIQSDAASDWSQFRGPTGQGSSESTSLPLHWSEEKNVHWKTPIHGRAWSSPVVGNDQIWLTTATEDGRKLSALCVDATDGEIIHDIKLFEVEHPQFAHKFNTYASPSPVIEADRVYITFGSPGTACLDSGTGRVLWERRDFECNHFRGAGSSPILYGDLLIMNFDGSDHQYVAALNKATGKTVWRTHRSIDFQDLGPDGKPQADGDWRKAFSTPHVAWFDGRPILLSIGAKSLYAYTPDDGRELWRVESRNCHSASSRPTVDGNRIYYTAGFSRGELWCVRPGGQGDVTGSHVDWTLKRGVPNKPSLILIDQHIYMIDDGGVASCVRTADGGTVWTGRVGGNYSASPISANGRIYFFSEEGKATVIEAGTEFKILAENQLANGFMASPAVMDSALILRTKSHLYRIEDR